MTETDNQWYGLHAIAVETEFVSVAHICRQPKPASSVIYIVQGEINIADAKQIHDYANQHNLSLEFQEYQPELKPIHHSRVILGPLE